MQFPAFVALAALSLQASSASAAQAALQASNHTSNWAVIVSTSRYWLNYRHSSNTLSIYRTVKRLGIPDSNIILMISDDAACNARNYLPAQVFNNESHSLDVYGQDVEVDYRGYEVSVENFIRVLTGRHDPSVPRSKRLMSDAGSNILIFLTGHGGDNFVKFQDVQELMGDDLQDALQQMHEKGRYHEVLVMVETCEAATVVQRIRAPNVLAVASSLKGESSWSYKTDMALGQSLVDRFTLLTLQFAERLRSDSTATLQQLFDTYDPRMMDCHSYVHRSAFRRHPAAVRVTDFFGSVAPTRALRVPLDFVLDAAQGVSRAVDSREFAQDTSSSGGLNISSCGTEGGGAAAAALSSQGSVVMNSTATDSRNSSSSSSSSSSSDDLGAGADLAGVDELLLSRWRSWGASAAGAGARTGGKGQTPFTLACAAGLAGAALGEEQHNPEGDWVLAVASVALLLAVTAASIAAHLQQATHL